MSNNNLALIRQAINEAHSLEANSGDLHRFLTALTPRLHNAIDLPENNPTDTLFDFVANYIDRVPEFLEVLDSLFKQVGIQKEGQVFLNIAEEYFINPPELIRHELGLKALIDEAYLAHRLMEEINDRLLMLCGVPLTPMDMTLSNIIVHDILGEEFANQLDLAVHYAIEALFDPANLTNNESLASFLAQHNPTAWGSALRQWPCLACDSAISLKFNSGVDTKVEMH